MSLSSASGSERFQVPVRFVSKLRTVVVDTPSEDELSAIYSIYLQAILGVLARIEERIA